MRNLPTLSRFTLVLVLLVASASMAPARLLAAENEGGAIVLPRRPQALTRAQYEALRKIARQPEHVAIANLRATYRDKTTEFASDGGQVAFLTALGGGILAVLIAAAPL